MNPKVDFFFDKAEKWQAEFAALRKVVLACSLDETLKWGNPCYTYENANIVLIHGFKEYCALLFFKGALLKDPERILIQQTENVQAARQIRFTRLQEIVGMKATLKAYINQAIEVEKAGLKIEFTKSKTLDFPEEFQKQLDADPKLQTAFAALTPGRQRAYNLYFTAAKQSTTRTARVEKCKPLILKGKGLTD